MSDKEQTTWVGMLASIFANIRAYGADHWREPIARSLDDVATALLAGESPEDVALICKAAARAIRSPSEHSKVRKEAEKRLLKRAQPQP